MTKRKHLLDLMVRTVIWRDDDFRSLTFTAQACAFRSVAYMGMVPTMGPHTFSIVELEIDEITYWAVRAALVRVGIWEDVSPGVIRVSQYKDLITLMEFKRPPMPLWIRRLVLDRDGHRCQYCGSDERLEIDHIYPYSRGGRNNLANLQVLCKPCNRAKGTKV